MKPEQGEAAPRGLPLSVEAARESVAAGLITAYALALRLVGAGRGLPYLHEWDEWFQVPPVIRMVLNHTLNPGIFIYGSLYYYLLLPVVYLHSLYLRALGVMKSVNDIVLMHPLVPGYGWYINFPSFYLWARAFTALLGAATVYLTYRLGRAAFGRTVGLLAAALLAVAPGAVYYSDTARVDVPEACLTTAALLAGLNVIRRGRRWDYLVAGLLAGLAMSTKQTAVWVVPALVLAHASGGRRTALIDRRLGLMFAAIVAGGLAGTPYLLIRPDLVRAGFDAQIGPYGVFSIPNPGDFLRHLGWNLGYLLRPTQGGDWYVVPHAALGLIPGAAAIAGLAVGYAHRPRVQAYLLTFPLLQLCFLARADVFYTRNLSPVLPLLAIWAALGAEWGWETLTAFAAASARPPASWERLQQRWRSAAAAAEAAVLVIFMLGPVRESAVLAGWLYRHHDTRTQAVDWLAGHVTRGRGVAFELELAWYLPVLNHLRFRTDWTDRSTAPSWYASHHIDYAVVSEWNPIAACPTVRFIPRPSYLPSIPEEVRFVPNSYPIIDPAITIVRPAAGCASTAPVVGSAPLALLAP